MSGATKGEQEAYKAMFTGHLLTWWGEKGTLIKGMGRLPRVTWGVSRALHQISRSPFSGYIEDMELPRHFIQPVFTIYNSKTSPVEHVSHFNKRITIHSRNGAFMCKGFPSSLGPTHEIVWWLEVGSIRSYEELRRAFGTKFVTCSRVSKLLDSLLSIAMK